MAAALLELRMERADREIAELRSQRSEIAELRASWGGTREVAHIRSHREAEAQGLVDARGGETWQHADGASVANVGGGGECGVVGDGDVCGGCGGGSGGGSGESLTAREVLVALSHATATYVGPVELSLVLNVPLIQNKKGVVVCAF